MTTITIILAKGQRFPKKDNSNFLNFITVRQWSFGKVIFSLVSVILSTGVGCVCLVPCPFHGVCLVPGPFWVGGGYTRGWVCIPLVMATTTYRVGKRAVGILLECFLVWICYVTTVDDWFSNRKRKSQSVSIFHRNLFIWTYFYYKKL